MLFLLSYILVMKRKSFTWSYNLLYIPYSLYIAYYVENLECPIVEVLLRISISVNLYSLLLKNFFLTGDLKI